MEAFKINHKEKISKLFEFQVQFSSSNSNSPHYPTYPCHFRLAYVILNMTVNLKMEFTWQYSSFELELLSEVWMSQSQFNESLSTLFRKRVTMIHEYSTIQRKFWYFVTYNVLILKQRIITTTTKKTSQLSLTS